MRMQHLLLISLLALASCDACIGNDKTNFSNSSRSSQNESAARGQRDLPDRTTVLGLVRNEQVVSVRLTLPNSTEEHRFDDKYQKLMDEGVLNCKYSESIQDGTPYYSNCRPGQAGIPLDDDLSMIIGYKKPSEVTGIVKRTESDVVADLTLTFVPDPSNDLFRTRRDVLNLIGKISAPNGLGPQSGKVFLRLYDDGWRVQRVCAIGEMSCY